MTTRALSLTPIAAVSDSLSRHLELVATLRPYIEPPPEWTALAARLRDFRAPRETPLRDRLIHAVVDGQDADHISELRALAESEATPTNPVLMQIVQGAVQVALTDLYEPVAPAAYSAVAQAFNEAAAKFAQAAGKCGDPELGSEQAVELSAPGRAAWVGSVEHAHELDRLVVLLVAAAELTGQVITDDETLLPLIIRNTDSVHLRQLWGAFLSANPAARQRNWVSKRQLAAQPRPPRCGRWSALVALGAELGAAPNPGEIRPVPKPPPLDRRQRRIPGEIADATFVFDPADSDYAEQLEAAGFPPRGAAYAS